MEVRKLKYRRNGLEKQQEFGQIEVGRGASKSQPSASEAGYNEYLEHLESIRLTGYRFLKPPGVSKTLKNIHEEEAYNREYTNSAYSDGNSMTMDMDGRSIDPMASMDRSRHENEHGSEENEEGAFDFTAELSFPTMDASLPSVYHRH